MSIVPNMRQPPLEWAVSGALILCLEEHTESCEQKLATQAGQKQFQYIRTCKYSLSKGIISIVLISNLLQR